ncbi:uncharacterized protein LOC127852309 [Dreissena polymorpha]|uniref:RWD domain-containing protein n=1 Tax=Dreissena polymorpha TaxID=45954 RepID=A0A9D4CFM5_DREPO|nr:uncharacterized protein LOC127852309 [Dreissena polymorpha]XP_052242205.1 uncharacterized protein LOC127852309 [Dreissena polymorpha]KAH3724365.1 hypothetical protein DPMN_050181 [Dreissena polymorpha]
MSEALAAELEEAKHVIPTLEGFTLVTCVPAQVRAGYKQTDYKHVNVILQFPDRYPQEPVVIQLTSKTLSERLLASLVRMCDEDVRGRLGQRQVLPVMRYVREFIVNNPLCVACDEITAIKRHLIAEMDKLKLKQELSAVHLKIVQDLYWMNLKLTVPDNYPVEQVSIEAAESNFPDLLKKFFVGQALEIARRCAQPPLKPKPRDPPFKPRPSLLEVCQFLVTECVKRYPQLNCPCCRERVMLRDPEAVAKDPRKRVERVYCGHLYHHGCLAKYLKTPPFKEGKFCPDCGKQIFHEKWRLPPELAEARWASKQARQRELAEVTDFLS